MKILKVTNLYEMSQTLGTNLNQCSDQTTLNNVDDDFGDVSFDINSAVTPKLPKRDFNIATLTPEKLEQLKKSSKP